MKPKNIRTIEKSSLARLGDLPRLVRMEDEILALHRRVAGVAAVGGSILVRRPFRGRSVIVEERVAPAAALREPLAVLLDNKSLREDVRHIDGERRFGALL